MEEKTRKLIELSDLVSTLPPEVLAGINTAFGTQAKSVNELFDSLMPPFVVSLKKLCTFYEQQMLKCAEIKAYYPATLLGAALIEGFLLICCYLNQAAVERTATYTKRARRQDYERELCRLGLEELRDIAHELDWIPADVVELKLRQALADAFRALSPILAPKLGSAGVEDAAEALFNFPGYALLRFLQNYRNFVHPGRCVREDQMIYESTADEWFHMAVVIICEIRDCLLVRFIHDCGSNAAKLMLAQKCGAAKLKACT